MALRGRMDGVFEGVLRGWLWDPDRPSTRLEGLIWLDGREVGAVRADLPRGDLAQAGFAEALSGLEFPLPIDVQDGAIHELIMKSEQDGVLLTVDQLTLLIPRRLHMLRGRAERIQAGTCIGWAWDRARPDEAVLVELLHEGRVRASQMADQPRPDLARARIGDGRHGFAFDLTRLDPPLPAGAALELRCTATFGEWPLGSLNLPAAPALVLTSDLAPPLNLAPARTRAGHAPRLTRREYLMAARKAEGERDHATAARLLDAGLVGHPDDFDLLSTRARIHLAEQELDAAERLARAALKLSPDHARALLLLARITTALGRHEEAAAFWVGIGPQEGAFRERTTKRARSLMLLGRSAEALSEIVLALQARPDDPELRRQMAETSEAAGAPRAALAHWRKLLALTPEDRLAQEREAALHRQLAPAPPAALASPLANPDLRDWRGPVEGEAASEAVWPASGLALRSLGGRLSFAPVAPRRMRAGELPVYGLFLQMVEGGAEVAFALAPEAGSGGLRMGLEVELPQRSPPIGMTLGLRRFAGDGSEAGLRVLRHIQVEPGPRLHRFDLALTPEEVLALRSAGVELVLRLLGPGAVQLRPPRALSRLRPTEPGQGGFETPDLALSVPPASPPSAELMDLACPFTSIAVAAPAEALVATVSGVLRGTAAPFECIVTVEPGWPESLAQHLCDLAGQDPRLRLLPPSAAAATGWVALIEAPPQGGADWLMALHQQVVAGRAEAAGVLLEWCSTVAA